MSSPVTPVGSSPLPGEFREGFVSRNPIFATTAGLCPSLAVTAVVQDTFVLSVVVVAVLLSTALATSLLRTVVGDRQRMLITLSLTATLTIVAELIISAYAPAVRASLGVYLPLVAVNAVVITQAHEMSWRSTPGSALAVAAGRALGFATGLLLIALLRESIGAGSITVRAAGEAPVVFHLSWLEEFPVQVIGTSAGAFLIVGYLTASLRVIRRRRKSGTVEGAV